MKTTATIQDVMNAKATIHKMLPPYFSAVERAKPIGRKSTMVNSVLANIGAASGDGGNVWRITISEPDASFINVIVLNFLDF